MKGSEDNHETKEKMRKLHLDIEARAINNRLGNKKIKSRSILQSVLIITMNQSMNDNCDVTVDFSFSLAVNSVSRCWQSIIGENINNN